MNAWLKRCVFNLVLNWDSESGPHPLMRGLITASLNITPYKILLGLNILFVCFFCRHHHI